MSDARICLGVIVGAKGVRGEVKIKSFAENAADVAAYGPLRTKDGRILQLTTVSATGDIAVARIQGVVDRDAAEALRGLELFVDRAALPPPDEGTFYQADLVGLAVERVSGENLGRVKAFHNFGGGDVLEVGDGAAVHWLPFNADVIAKVDLVGGKVVVTPIPGLIDDEPGRDGQVSDAT